MPYQSDSQRRWAHKPSGMKALGGAAKVAEWDAASKGMDLPEKSGKHKPVSREHLVKALMMHKKS